MTIRPLRDFSNFVAVELPFVLETRACELPEIIAHLVGEISEECIKTARAENPEVALLDLKMAEAAIAHSVGSEKIPSQLLHLNAVLCLEGQSPGLTYHDLVIVNPKQDIRLFTRGDVGRTERFFYTSHAKAEVIFEEGLQLLASGAEIDSERERLESIAKITEALGYMTDGHFGAFRQYLKKLPHREIQGPSGAHTFRVPLLDLLLWGDWLPDEYRQEIFVVKLHYFPPEGRERILAAAEAAKKGLSYKDQALGNRCPTLRHNIMALAIAMERFREEHVAAVRRQIPEVFANKAPGTSGNATAGSYIRRRMEAMAALRERFEAEFIY